MVLGLAGHATAADLVLKGFGNPVQLGLDSQITPASPVDIPDGPADATAAAVGGSRALVLTPAGVLTTGSGANLLGLDIAAPSLTVLTPIPDTDDVTAVALGDAQSLLLREDGTVDGIGDNNQGQAGGTIVAGQRRRTPTPIAGLAEITAISAGRQFSLALDEDGAVWAWGLASRLGNAAATANTGTPVRVVLPAGRKAVEISAGFDHAIARLDDGTLWAWGANGQGQLGDGTTTARTEPVQVQSLTGLTVSSISTGNGASFALLDDGSFRAWGRATNGRLGLGLGDVVTSRLVPTAPSASAPSAAYPAFDRLVSGGATTYAITRSGGQVYAWGAQGANRALGGDAIRAIPFGTGPAPTATSDTEVPQRVGALSDVPWLAVGGSNGNAGAAQLLRSASVLRISQNSQHYFYSREVGTVSPAQPVQVHAVGGDATVTGLSLGGANATDFHIVRPTSLGSGLERSYPFTLASGQSSNFAVQFVPTELGERHAYLQVTTTTETLRVPLEGFGTPLVGQPGEQGPKGDTVVGPAGPKGDTITVTVPSGGTISIAAARSVTTARRGSTARLPFVLLNGTARTLAKTTATATVPRAVRATGKSSAPIAALKSGADRRFSVPVAVGRTAKLGTHRIVVRTKVAGRTVTRTVRLRVTR